MVVTLANVFSCNHIHSTAANLAIIELARSQMVSSDCLASDVSSDGLQHSSDTSQFRYMVGIYLSMVDAVLAAIQEYSQTLDIAKTKEKCLSSLLRKCDKLNNPVLQEHLRVNSNIQFKLVALNSDHSEVPLTVGEVCKKLKFISLSVYDLPSLQSSGDISIGSMVFSETFLDSVIQVSGITDVSSDVLILTSCIPRHQMWSLNGHIKKTNPTPPKLPTNQWGEPLMTQGDIYIMGSWTALLPPEKVVLTAWNHGLTIQTSDYGSFSLYGSDMSSVSLYDGDSMSQVVLLLLEINLTSIMADHLPPHLCTEVNDKGISTIVLAFNPHTKAHTQLFGNVLPAWKEESQLPEVKRLSVLHSPFQQIHAYLQKQSETSSSSNISPLKKVAATMPHLHDFLQHLTTSCGLYGSVTKDVYHSLVGDFILKNETTEDKIVITIITGAPGSGKDVLANVIASYNTNIINWVIFKQSEECQVDTMNLHKAMTTATQKHSHFLLSKTTRLIIVAPGFCDTSEVLRAVNSHSDHSYRSLFVIGAVTVCIDPLNFYMEHKLILPMLTAQCAQGWVNNIVFTSQTTAPSELLNSLQALIRSINKDVALLKAEQGHVKRSTDLDLILSETAFSDVHMERARVLLKPYWREGYPHAWPCRPVMNDVLLNFTYPLEKHLTLINLRNLKKSFKSHPYSGNIYYINGLLAFTGSAQLFDLQFSPLNGKLILNNSNTSNNSGDNPAYSMTFTGVNLKEEDIKNFLNTCVKQRPEKKKLLTREDLTKQEIDKIHASHHLDDLPEGWYYNGSQFVSMDGERTLTHPNLDKFILDYLDKKNRDIDHFNNRIDSDSYITLWQQ
ncbi:hypothetical protein Btru_020839 [Bulinus truncatus]|nr:hypothetical protein Btru_020839 [Bulinus truncatus]